GGELIIPTIILIYGVDIKLAGTLSLMVSIPTILISLYKHYRHNRLEVITHNNTFLLYMIGGTFAGSYLGSLAVGMVDSYWLEVFLAELLLISAVKMKYLKGKD
ncbi:MAG: sulfite exporter TauE/SafE family protein, partial [Campylobacterales bacterium]|nr:sulfite exporter TauE/SafE family protein [Campylobacterales bacterium]